MTTRNDLRDEVIRLRNMVDPGWEHRARKERQAQANSKVIRLQRRLLVSNQLGVPLPEVSQEFADGYCNKGLELGTLDYDE